MEKGLLSNFSAGMFCTNNLGKLSLGMTAEERKQLREQEAWDNFWGGALLSACKRSKWRNTPTVKNILRAFEALGLPSSARILDAGCGSGTLARYWLDRGNSIIGLDFSDKALQITRQTGVPCIKANVARGLPFADHSFELVYTDALLEHFLSPKQALKELFRVSKKYVLSIVPRDNFLNNLLTAITKPPKEYKRGDIEWIELHKAFKPASIKAERSMLLNLIILCEVNRAE